MADETAEEAGASSSDLAIHLGSLMPALRRQAASEYSPSPSLPASCSSSQPIPSFADSDVTFITGIFWVKSCCIFSTLDRISSILESSNPAFLAYLLAKVSVCSQPCSFGLWKPLITFYDLAQACSREGGGTEEDRAGGGAYRRILLSIVTRTLSSTLAVSLTCLSGLSESKKLPP